MLFTFTLFTFTMMIMVAVALVAVLVVVGRLDSKSVIRIGSGWPIRIESENWTILERNHSDGLSINSSGGVIVLVFMVMMVMMRSS